jgi:hypothetical protein
MIACRSLTSWIAPSLAKPARRFRKFSEPLQIRTIASGRSMDGILAILFVAYLLRGRASLLTRHSARQRGLLQYRKGMTNHVQKSPWFS